MLKEKQVDMEQLEGVTGGRIVNPRLYSRTEQLMRMECPYCHEIFQADVQAAVIKCPVCHKTITMKG